MRRDFGWHPPVKRAQRLRAILDRQGVYSPGMLPHILSKAGRLPAVHPKNAELIEPGRIYVAPPDRHMLVRRGYIRQPA